MTNTREEQADRMIQQYGKIKVLGRICLYLAIPLLLFGFIFGKLFFEDYMWRTVTSITIYGALLLEVTAVYLKSRWNHTLNQIGNYECDRELQILIYERLLERYDSIKLKWTYMRLNLLTFYISNHHFERAEMILDTLQQEYSKMNLLQQKVFTLAKAFYAAQTKDTELFALYKNDCHVINISPQQANYLTLYEMRLKHDLTGIEKWWNSCSPRYISKRKNNPLQYVSNCVVKAFDFGGIYYEREEYERAKGCFDVVIKYGNTMYAVERAREYETKLATYESEVPTIMYQCDDALNNLQHRQKRKQRMIIAVYIIFALSMLLEITKYL